ncbi:MAG: IclR family transcriptional regulator [Synergistota bacterium]|nr:IclR family transcriptional regulator [Synergistota bacterium]
MEKQGIRVLQRLFDILSYLSERNDYAGIKEISEGTGLSRTTVHRILGTCEDNYVVLKDKIGRYRLGPRSLEWANSYQLQTGLAKIARPHLKELIQDLKETVHLFIYEKGEAFYLEKMHSYSPTGMDSRIGSRLELYSTSAGKAILAALPEDEFELYMETTEFQPKTEKTEVDKDRFRSEIAQVRTIGYGMDDQENDLGVRCIGSAVMDKDGYPVGAVSLTGPIFRITDEKIEPLGKRILATARLISYQLGYSAS